MEEVFNIEEHAEQVCCYRSQHRREHSAKQCDEYRSRRIKVQRQSDLISRKRKHHIENRSDQYGYCSVYRPLIVFPNTLFHTSHQHSL